MDKIQKTVRLDPELNEQLKFLSEKMHSSINALVDVALRRFVSRELGEVESELEQTLQRLRDYRARNASHAAAIARVAEAEAALEFDPAEGSMIDDTDSQVSDEMAAVLGA